MSAVGRQLVLDRVGRDVGQEVRVAEVDVFFVIEGDPLGVPGFECAENAGVLVLTEWFEGYEPFRIFQGFLKLFPSFVVQGA